MKCTLCFVFFVIGLTWCVDDVRGCLRSCLVPIFLKMFFERFPFHLQPGRNRPMSSHTHHVRPHQNSQRSGATETTHHLNSATHGSPRMAPNISGEQSGLSRYLSSKPWANPHQKADVASNQCSLSLADNWSLVVLAHHITISTEAWNWN